MKILIFSLSHVALVEKLRYEGVPRSNYPAEHECRKKRCYGWADMASLQRSLSQLQRPPPQFTLLEMVTKLD
jgi:hypothetical protein